MTSDEIPTKSLLIGVVVAAATWEFLQIVGGYYIDHVLQRSSSTYGVFALVIALLIWLHLGAQMTLFAAEINVVVARKLWPRSLFGDPDPSRGPGDAARAGQGRGALAGGAGRRAVSAADGDTPTRR